MAGNVAQAVCFERLCRASQKCVLTAAKLSAQSVREQSRAGGLVHLLSLVGKLRGFPAPRVQLYGLHLTSRHVRALQ